MPKSVHSPSYDHFRALLIQARKAAGLSQAGVATVLRRPRSKNEIGRLNITLPKRTIAALEAVVPDRGKSTFIAQAIEEKLERERWETAFTTVQQLPPTLTHITNPVQWVADLRQEDEQRVEGRDV